MTPFGGHSIPKSQLVNTYWQLESINGQPVKAGKNSRRAYILLTAENHKLQGFAGCNAIRGHYQRSHKQLNFKSVAQSQMTCHGHMGIENALLQALHRTRRIKIHNHHLALLNSQGKVIARFNARIKQYKAN